MNLTTMNSNHSENLSPSRPSCIPSGQLSTKRVSPHRPTVQPSARTPLTSSNRSIPATPRIAPQRRPYPTSTPLQLNPKKASNPVSSSSHQKNTSRRKLSLTAAIHSPLRAGQQQLPPTTTCTSSDISSISSISSLDLVAGDSTPLVLSPVIQSLATRHPFRPSPTSCSVDSSPVVQKRASKCISPQRGFSNTSILKELEKLRLQRRVTSLSEMIERKDIKHD
ncbi:hypothetical protein DL96DRAFT_1587417 [Flagelloscypha sp. PMI_526]|nr:hypothetical protein DL96DRAFT_1587417 [Flagelloscypha sp. PMI_526]